MSRAQPERAPDPSSDPGDEADRDDGAPARDASDRLDCLHRWLSRVQWTAAAGVGTGGLVLACFWSSVPSCSPPRAPCPRAATWPATSPGCSPSSGVGPGSGPWWRASCSPFTTLALNVALLPAPARPGWARRGLHGLAGAFFAAVSAGQLWVVFGGG